MSNKGLRVFLEERCHRHAGNPFAHHIQCREARPDGEIELSSTHEKWRIHVWSARFQLYIKPCLVIMPAMLGLRQRIEPKPDLFCGK
jgi:hypothetical protein